MDTVGTIVTGNNLNVQGVISGTQVINQTIGTEDFMTAFMNAVAQGTSVVSQIEAEGEMPQEILQNPQQEIVDEMLANTKMPEIVVSEEIFSDEEKSTQVVTDNVEKLSSDVAKQLITTGNAKDFSAGYLGLILNSENAVDKQAILTSVDTLNGSIAQSIGLLSALQDNGVSDFLGLLGDDYSDTLSAQQLVTLATITGQKSSSDTLLEYLLDENFGGVGKIDSDGLTALLGGFGDYSGQDVLSVLSGTSSISSVLSAFDDDDDNDSVLSSNSILSSILSGNSYSASDLISSIFSSSDSDNDVAIPLSSVIPLNALKELSNVQQKQQIENLETLAKAFENGEAEVLKTTEFVNLSEQETSQVDESTQSQTQAIMEQNSFDNAVREAKKSLRTNDTEKKSTFSVESVNASLNGLEIAQDKLGEISKIQRDDISSTEIARQTAEKISARLSFSYEQKDTFSIKLTPEGLGDVVVSFEKTDGGMLLNITASQSRTAKLLSGEIDTIQSTLGQLGTQNLQIRIDEPQQSQTENFSEHFAQEGYQQNGQSFNQNSSGKRNARKTILQTAQTEKSRPELLSTGAINTII